MNSKPKAPFKDAQIVTPQQVERMVALVKVANLQTRARIRPVTPAQQHGFILGGIRL